jgi:hypothetical protein
MCLVDDSGKYDFTIKFLELITGKAIEIQISDFNGKIYIHNYEPIYFEHWDYIHDRLKKRPINYIIDKILPIGNKKFLPRMVYVDENRRIKIDNENYKLYIDETHIL